MPQSPQPSAAETPAAPPDAPAPRRFPDRTPSRRALSIGACLWIAALLVPPLILCFYAHPLYDDFFHTQAAAEAWARTGSLAAALSAAWERLVWLYQTWQGTFAAMAVSVFPPMVFSQRLFFLTPLTALLALAGSAWYAVRSLARYALRLSRAETLVCYAAFLTLWLGFLPGAKEAVYWQSGTPYALSAAMLAFLAGLLLRLHAEGRRRALRTVALALCGIALGGGPYPLALGGAVTLMLTAVWALAARSKARAGALVAFGFTAAALAAVLLAPGNGVRQESVGEALPPIAAIVQSMAECLQTTGSWLTPQWAAAGLVGVAVLWQPLRASGLRVRHPVWISLFALGAVAAAFVPAIYATGVEGGRIDRVQATLYLFFTLTAGGVSVVWIGFLAPRFPAYRPALPGWKLALCAVLCAWGLFGSAILTTPSVSAGVSLLTGQAGRYRAEMAARDEAIAAAPTLQAALDEAVDIPDVPNLFRSDGMALQPEAVTSVTHRYYALQSLMDRYGAGHIPQAEWDKLDAWE